MPRVAFLLLSLCVLATAGTLRAQNTKENADFKLAINLYNDGLYDLAEEQLKQFIGSYPNTSQGIDARFTLGLTELKLKKYDDARLTFQTFALTYQDNPKAPDAWWNVGEAFAALKNPRDAALAYERVKVFHPRSRLAADALVQAGRYFEAAGERNDARRVLRVVLQEYPSSAGATAARTQLARIYIADGNLEQARNELRRVTEGDPSADAKAQALLLMGQVDQLLGRADQAENAYREVITKHKTTSALRGAHVALGGLLASAGDHEGAREEFRRALNEKGAADSTTFRDALAGMADAERALNNHKDALASYERFLATYPQDPRVPEMVWKIAGTAAAARAYRKSNDACQRLLRGDGPDLLKRRAMVLLSRNAAAQKNFTAAVQALASFVVTYPEDRAAPLLSLEAAEITEREIRDHRKAATLYEVITTRFPSSPVTDDALAGIARCLETVKDYGRAAEFYRELVHRFPASDHRAQAEERIFWIETFDIREKDSGLEKLALLVGDVVADKDKAGLAFRLGEIYFSDLKNYEAATSQFAAALDAGVEGPRRNDALFLRARAFDNLSLKDRQFLPRAIEGYEEFLRAAPGDPRAEEAAFRLFAARATGFSAAQTAADSLLSRFPSFGQKGALFFRLGRIAREADSTSAAIRYFRVVSESFASSPPAEEALEGLFSLYLSSGKRDSALTLGDRYVQSYPGGRFAATVLARMIPALLDSGMAGEAAEYAATLSEQFVYAPAAANARTLRATALSRAQEWEPAIVLYRQLLAEQETDALTDGEPSPALLSGLAAAAYASGDRTQAKKFALQYLARTRSGPDAGTLLTMLGIIARGDGQQELANAYFRQALQVAPETAASEEIAGILFDSGAYEDALQQYTMLGRKSQNDQQRQLFESRAVICRFRNDEVKEAERAATAFLKAYPDAEESRAAFEVERGTSLFRNEDYDKAIKSFDQVIDKHGTTGAVTSALYWRGKTLSALNKQPEAIQQLQSLLKEYPGSPMTVRAHLALGNIYYGVEQWDEAIKHYRAVVDDSTTDAALLPMGISNLIETYETAGFVRCRPLVDPALPRTVSAGRGCTGQTDQGRHPVPAARLL